MKQSVPILKIFVNDMPSLIVLALGVCAGVFFYLELNSAVNVSIFRDGTYEPTDTGMALGFSAIVMLLCDTYVLKLIRSAKRAFRSDIKVTGSVIRAETIGKYRGRAR